MRTLLYQLDASHYFTVPVPDELAEQLWMDEYGMTTPFVDLYRGDGNSPVLVLVLRVRADCQRGEVAIGRRVLLARRQRGEMLFSWIRLADLPPGATAEKTFRAVLAPDLALYAGVVLPLRLEALPC